MKGQIDIAEIAYSIRGAALWFAENVSIFFGIALLASLKAEIGTLDRVTRIVKLLAMVNSAPAFGDQPKVANGVSDLLVDVFGDRGKHARSAVGMVNLPGGIPVEVEMIVEVQA